MVWPWSKAGRTGPGPIRSLAVAIKRALDQLKVTIPPAALRHLQKKRPAAMPLRPASDVNEAPPLDPQRQLEQATTQAQAQAKSIYLGDHTAMCRILGRHLIFVDTRDVALAPHLMWDGFWEMWITQAMARCFEPGMVVVDVGANFGYYSLLMADAVGPTGKVFAFEPNPNIARLLGLSSSINGFRDRLTVDTRAAYSTTGEQLRFFIPGDYPMNASLYTGLTGDDKGPTLEEAMIPAGADVSELPEVGVLTDVETIKLDDALPERVDFVKIDAEGAEREIWHGLTRTLRANAGIRIFLEFNAGRYGSETEKFLDEIGAFDFELAFVDFDSRVKPITRPEILSRGATELMLYLSR
jgi:FkbM family methyltransferase